MILVVVAALACVIGSLVFARSEFGPEAATEAVFGTWWFMLLVGLLALNLTLCSWRRSYAVVKSWFSPHIVADRGFYQGPASYSFPWEGKREDLLRELRRMFTLVHMTQWAAHGEKGLLRRAGPTIVHIGLLWIIAAAFLRVLSAHMGWGVYHAMVSIPEGQSTSEYYTMRRGDESDRRGSTQWTKLPFTIRALDFRAEFHPNSSVASKFSSLVEIIDAEGQGARIYEINMANALTYKGFKLTQNSYQADPAVTRGRFRVVDPAGKAQVVDASPGDPVRLDALSPDLFLEVEDLHSSSAVRIFNLAAAETIFSGYAAASDKQSRDFRVMFLGTTRGYRTDLGISRDPSVPWMFAGCIILALGACASFLLGRVEMWLWYDADAKVLWVRWSPEDSPANQAQVQLLATRLRGAA